MSYKLDIPTLRLLTWIFLLLCFATISMQAGEESDGHCVDGDDCSKSTISVDDEYHYDSDGCSKYSFSMQTEGDAQEFRLVLLGITGVGKSTLANAIVEQEKFKVGGLSHSTTKSCQKETTNRNGRKLRVVDSPGFFDTEMKFGELQTKILPFLQHTSPGPHAIIYVQEAGKFTEEQEKGFQLLLKIFGEKILNFTTIAFTKLGYGVTEEEYLDSQHEILKNLTLACENRVKFLPSPDKIPEMKKKVDELLKIIENMISKNRCQHYTDEMYKAQQKILEEEMERKRQIMIEEEKKKLRAERAKIQAEFEEVLKQMQEQSEAEKKKHEERIEKLEADRKSNYEDIKNLHERIRIADQKIADKYSYFWSFFKLFKKIFG